MLALNVLFVPKTEKCESPMRCIELNGLEMSIQSPKTGHEQPASMKLTPKTHTTKEPTVIFLLKRRNVIVICLFAMLLISPRLALAADYLGAAAVLEKISQKPQAGASEKVSKAGELKRDIESFKNQSPSLPPEQAAQQWLKLLNRQLDLSPGDLQGGFESAATESGFNLGDIWNALPPPPAWDALRKAIEARPQAKGMNAARELCLQLIAHTLTADHAAQTNDLARMNALVAKADEGESGMLANVIQQISQRMTENAGDADAIMASLERQLASTGEYRTEFTVPNLVPLVGEQKTTNFLRYIFSHRSLEVGVPQRSETAKLARKLALEMVNELQVPQWRLTYSLDGSELFEALEKKFPPHEPETNRSTAAFMGNDMNRRALEEQNNRSYAEARLYYLFSLVSQNRTKEAVAIAQKMGHLKTYYVPSETVQQLDRAGYGKALNDFFYELLSQNPELPFWEEYIPLAAEVGETDQMLELARKTASREDLSEKQRDTIRQNLIQALLAADHVDEAVAEIQKILSQSKHANAEGSDAEMISCRDLALMLASIGQLTGHTNWMEEGIRSTREEIEAQGQSPHAYGMSETVKGLANLLMEIGRGPEAESILTEALAGVSAKSELEAVNSWSESPSRVYLATLVSVYYRAGRYTDVLTLLDQAKGWGAKDLAELHDTDLDTVHQHEDSTEDSVRRDVAASLLALGRKEEAAKMANAILDEDSSYDPAYEVLLKTGGSDLIRRFDELFARDQFETRPLIWKAIVLEQDGKLEEAEAMARKAISIDPSDGAQGPGRRMRAYSVLADIRKARGDEKEADFFRGAVDAIRLSENADRYYRAGLLKEAVAMYEVSLTKFEGAYCIQSRLALRLSELGKPDEAAEHYRRAYELMPDSFGRVESHCFGCEGAFRGAQAQSIANKVFTSLVKSTPQKPQVHYLLGYLREEQGNYAEALSEFRDAVKLDPDYLNAWKHLESVGAQYYLSATDRNSIALTMLRLDPLRRHGGGIDLEGVTDLRALWSAVDAANRFQPKLADALYPLPASKAQMEKPEAQPRTRYEISEMMDDNSNQNLQPAQAVMQNAIISAARELVAGRFSVFD